jgi:hypothetical protein
MPTVSPLAWPIFTDSSSRQPSATSNHKSSPPTILAVSIWMLTIAASTLRGSQPEGKSSIRQRQGVFFGTPLVKHLIERVCFCYSSPGAILGCPFGMAHGEVCAQVVREVVPNPTPFNTSSCRIVLLV